MINNTPNRDAIHAAFTEVVKAYEAGDLTPVAPAFADSVRLQTTQHGDATGRDAVVNTLSGVSPQGETTRYFLTNEYIAIDGEKAQQSAYLSVAVTEGAEATPSVSWFGGHFANSWALVDARWQLTELRFELDWTNGGNQTLRSWPAAREGLGWAPGVPLPKIISALDAPWHVLPENTELGSAEQQVIDAFTRYTWAVDQWDLTLMRDVFTKDIKTNISPFGKLYDRREFLSTLQLFRSGRVYLHHVMGDTVVNVDGDRASLKVFRLVPYGATPELLQRNIYGATYECTLRHENDVWKFDSITFTEGQLFEVA